MLSVDLAAFGPEVFLAILILGFITYGAIVGEKATRPVALMTIAGLVIAAAWTAFGGIKPGTYFNDLVAVSAFTSFAKIIVYLVSAVSLYMALPYIERSGNRRFEFPLLYLFATLGMAILVSAQDLLSLYLGLELMSLSLYVLAALRRDSSKASEAGLKYFILGALSSGMILYGSSIVYGYAGATNFDMIADALSGQDRANLGLLFGLAFLIAGLAFKVSVAPFHMWTPDVYQGAPITVTAFFAGAPKIAAMAIFVRLLVEPFAGLTPDWQQIIAVIAMGSMIVGSLAALGQRNVKRLMAYSSIANMGYALMGLAAGTVAGIQGLLVYLLIYVVMTMGAFAVILTIRRDDRPLESIDDLAGLFSQKPGLATAMTVIMFSLGGIPPLAGFWGKFLVFRAAIDDGAALLIMMAIVGALTSVVATFYYLRIIKLMMFDAQEDELDHRPRSEWQITAIVSALALVLMTVFFQTIWSWSAVATASLGIGA